MPDPDTHVAARVIDAHKRLDEHNLRIHALETAGAVAEERARQIQASLTKIETMVGRVVWIIMSAIIGAIITFLLRGGFHV